MNKTTLLLVAAAIIAADANAETKEGNVNQKEKPKQEVKQNNDLQYKAPLSYDNRYYPHNDEGNIGYYGTERNAQQQESPYQNLYYYY